MDTQQERLSHLDHALSNGENICSSEGMLCSFPTSLKKPFMINGAGLIVCRQGNFTFSLNMKVFSAQAGETVFIPEDSLFQVLSESEDLQLFIFIYQIEPIRDIIGNSVATMYLYMQLRTEPCYVWNTGDEEEVLKYMSLLDNTLHLDNNTFNDNEQRLLLLGLTYRICSIYNRKLMNLKTTVGHKHEIFIRLIQLIDAHYTEERGVEFYADKLCLSPKYLLCTIQVRLRIHRAGTDIQIHHPQKHLTTQEHPEKYPGNRRFLQFSQCFLFWYIFQETNRHVSATVPQKIENVTLSTG